MFYNIRLLTNTDAPTSYRETRPIVSLVSFRFIIIIIFQQKFFVFNASGQNGINTVGVDFYFYFKIVAARPTIKHDAVVADLQVIPI